MTITNSLAKYIFKTSFCDLPSETVKRLAKIFVDQIGIGYMGYRKTGVELGDYAFRFSGSPEAIIIGSNRKVSCAIAAGVNAQLARNTNFEDSGPGLHPGPLIVHTALAAAQMANVSGKEILTAMAIGYELNYRFFKASKKAADIGYNNLIAAAISAKLFRFNLHQISKAISLCWEFPVKRINYSKPKLTGRISALGMGHFFSANSGVQSSLMTLDGFISLEDELDYLEDEYDFDCLLNSDYQFKCLEKSVFLKFWPASHASHMVLEATEELIMENKITSNDIISVKVGLPDIYLLPHQNNSRPKDYWEAIYSFAWSMAMVIHRIPPGPQWFEGEVLANTDYTLTTDKISVEPNTEATKSFQRLDLSNITGWVILETTKGILSCERCLAKTAGSPLIPLDEKKFISKFRTVLKGSKSVNETKNLYEVLSNISKVTKINDIVSLL